MGRVRCPAHHDGRLWDPGRLALTVSSGGDVVDMRLVGGDGYLKANRAYWATEGMPARVAALLANRWVKFPAATTPGTSQFIGWTGSRHPASRRLVAQPHGGPPTCSSPHPQSHTPGCSLERDSPVRASEPTLCDVRSRSGVRCRAWPARATGPSRCSEAALRAAGQDARRGARTWAGLSWFGICADTSELTDDAAKPAIEHD